MAQNSRASINMQHYYAASLNRTRPPTLRWTALICFGTICCGKV